MAMGRVIFTLPLLYQQLFYTPPPPAEPEVAVDAINAGVSITTSRVSTRTLHYQAKAYCAGPIEVFSPPPPEPESFQVTTGQQFRKSLFYQAKVEPVYAPPAAAVVADIAWHAPFSAPPPRRLFIQQRQNQPFVAPPAPQVTADEWLQPFKRQVAVLSPVHTQPTSVFAAAPQVTVDEWLQPFRRVVPVLPPVHTQPVSGYQPEAVVVSNLTTTLEWLQPFQKAVSPPRPATSQPVSGYQPEAVVVSNLTTSLEWMQSWAGPPRYWPQKTALPFIPTQAPAVTADTWLVPFGRAASSPQVHHTQPVLGSPAINTRTEWDWSIQWQGPPRRLQPLAAGAGYFLPPPNARSEWDWSIAWQGPPRRLQRLAAGLGAYLPPSNYRNEWDWPLAWNLAARTPKPVHTQPVLGYPYASVENTLGHIAWLQPFYKAVPAPPVRVSQPVFGYPYEFVTPPPNLTTTLEWMPSWQGSPRIPQRLAGGPVLPPAATPSIANTVTGMAWLQAFRGPPRYTPLKVQALPFVPKAAVIDVVTLEWMQAWRGPPRQQAARFAQIAWSYAPVVVDNTTTIDKWKLEWNLAAKAPKPVHTQPFYGYPYEGVVTTFAASEHFSVDWQYPTRKTLFYQAWARALYEIPAANTETIDKWYQPLSRAPSRPGVFSGLYTPFVPPEQAVTVVYEQQVTATITVALDRVLRYSCKAELQDGFSDAAEQADQWVTQGQATDTSAVVEDECVDAFQDEAYQEDAFDFCLGIWATADEVVDAWTTQTQLPQPPCCGADDVVVQDAFQDDAFQQNPLA